MKEPIKLFSGYIIGYIETDSRGNKTVTNYAGQILGYYKADRNVTTNFAGQVLYFGDMASSFLKQ